MSGFVLTKDQQDLKRLAADFGKKVMRPAAKEYDLKGETPLDIYRQAVKTALLKWRCRGIRRTGTGLHNTVCAD